MSQLTMKSNSAAVKPQCFADTVSISSKMGLAFRGRNNLAEPSFGCAFHDGFLLLAQPVERIHQLVNLPLQRPRVLLGIALLCRE